MSIQAGVHVLVQTVALLPAQLPIPDPAPLPPPGSEKILESLSWMKWAAPASFIGLFLAGFVAAGVGRVFHHDRSGRMGAQFIVTSLVLALLYGIMYGLLTRVSGPS